MMNKFDGYFIADDSNGLGPCLGPTGPWKAELAEVMKQNGIKVLRLAQSAGWQKEDLNFLSDLDFLLGIEIYNWDVTDLSPLLRNQNLRLVAANCSSDRGVDLSVLTNLEVCLFDVKSKILGLEQCENLKKLNVVGFQDDDFARYEHLKGLTIVSVTSRKLKTLKGLERLANLHRIDLFDCRVLFDISAISDAAELTEIEIENCKSIGGLPEEPSWPNLTRIGLNNTGNIQSLNPLLKSKNLSTVSFYEDTKVIDGDIRCLLQLPKLANVSFMNRRSYNMTREQLRIEIKNREQDS